MISRRTFFGFAAAAGAVIATARRLVLGHFRRYSPGYFRSLADGREIRYAWEDVPYGILKCDGITDNRSARARIDDGFIDPKWFASRKAEVEAAKLDHDLLTEELAKLDAPPVNLESRARANARKAEILAQADARYKEWLGGATQIG